MIGAGYLLYPLEFYSLEFYSFAVAPGLAIIVHPGREWDWNSQNGCGGIGSINKHFSGTLPLSTEIAHLLSLLRGQFPFPWLIQASDSAFQLMESSPFPLKSTHLLSTLESLFHTHRLEHLWLEETHPRHVLVIPNSEISALGNLPYTYISYTYDLSSFI